MNLIKTMKQALEALEVADYHDVSPRKKRTDAITNLRALIEQLEQLEPFAWAAFDGEGGYDLRLYEGNEYYKEHFDARNPNHKNWMFPLYAMKEKK